MQSGYVPLAAVAVAGQACLNRASDHKGLVAAGLGLRKAGLVVKAVLDHPSRPWWPPALLATSVGGPSRTRHSGPAEYCRGLPIGKEWTWSLNHA